MTDKYDNKIMQMLHEDGVFPTNRKLQMPPDPNRHTEEERRNDIVHEDAIDEGIVSDLLVKLKVIDSKKFVDAIFSAVDKKLRGMEKKAVKSKDGKQVIDLGTAISYVGGKKGEINFTEMANSVEDLKRSTNSLVQKYERLTNVVKSGATDYIDFDTAKDMLGMMMAVGQVADFVRTLNDKIEDTAQDVEVAVTAKKEPEEAPPEEEKPSEEPVRPEAEEKPGEKEDKKNAAEAPTPEEVDAAAKVAKEVDPGEAADKEEKLAKIIQKFFDDHKGRKPKKMSDLKMKQYKENEEDVAMAIEGIVNNSTYSLDQAKKIVDNAIMYGKVKLKSNDMVMFELMMVAFTAIAAVDVEDITDPGFRQAAQQEIGDIKAEFAAQAKAENKVYNQETILEYLRIDGVIE